MREVIGEDVIIQAITEFQRKKRHVHLIGYEIDYIDLEYDEKAREVKAEIQYVDELVSPGEESDSDALESAEIDNVGTGIDFPETSPDSDGGGHVAGHSIEFQDIDF